MFILLSRSDNTFLGHGYLEYGSRNAVSVTTPSSRAYMGDVIRWGLAKHPQLWKDALNWFFREGRRHCEATPRLVDHAMPTLGQADTGAQPCERRLIERLRIQHYAWRTEKTYREWAWRLPLAKSAQSRALQPQFRTRMPGAQPGANRGDSESEGIQNRAC